MDDIWWAGRWAIGRAGGGGATTGFDDGVTDGDGELAIGAGAGAAVGGAIGIGAIATGAAVGAGAEDTTGIVDLWAGSMLHALSSSNAGTIYERYVDM